MEPGLDADKVPACHPDFNIRWFYTFTISHMPACHVELSWEGCFCDELYK